MKVVNEKLIQNDNFIFQLLIRTKYLKGLNKIINYIKKIYFLLVLFLTKSVMYNVIILNFKQ